MAASKKTERRKRQKAGTEKILARGKEPGIKLTERHKEKIRVSMLLNRLEEFALDKDGEIEMSPQQVTAASILLKKFVPDLQAIHQTDNKDKKTHEEWLDELERKTAEGEVEE